MRSGLPRYAVRVFLLLALAFLIGLAGGLAASAIAGQRGVLCALIGFGVGTLVERWPRR